MERKTVLKDSKEQLVVDSVKCCGHVQEDESTYATLVNAIDEIVVDIIARLPSKMLTNSICYTRNTVTITRISL